MPQTVHMANNSGQEIYVMVSLDPDWAIVDIVTDIGLLLVGVGEIKSVVTAAELPATLNTMRNLYEFLKITAKLLGGMASVGTRPTEAALSLINAFKKTSIPISQGEYKNINDESFWSTYFNASGMASLLGANTLSVVAMSGDGKQVAMWNTGPDDSWIAIPREKIVRSKFGTLWEEDPSAGSEDWPVHN
ncbi:hypothetical protein ARMSODRAFT_984589 [Armillaria solidipes]|uniref:Uncharacterized protein n=1 Tax=Armillaria solidipes TaxID=1076256 RepID=A0A2H3CTK4_9AGAR|nr:hypothetical protein ARMSODRAFT_984589 [Armillaria solidipes]